MAAIDRLRGLLEGATVGSGSATIDDLLTAPCGHCGNHVGKVGRCWHGTVECCACGRVLPRSVRHGRPPLMLNRDWEWPVNPTIAWWREALIALAEYSHRGEYPKP